MNSIRSAWLGSPREISPRSGPWGWGPGYLTGRACERKAKPVSAGVNPRAAGRSPVGALMVGDGMAGSSLAVIRETRRGQAVFTASGPKSRPAGVRASVVALKRVTTVERRDVGKWLGNETERRLKIGDSGGNASTS